MTHPLRRLLFAPPSWLDRIQPIDVVAEVENLIDRTLHIDEIFCHTGSVGQWCQQKGISWHGWEMREDFLTCAIYKVGFDVSQKKLPPPASSSFILALFAPLSRFSSNQLKDFSRELKDVLRSGGRALIELWCQKEDVSKKTIMDSYNGQVKLARALMMTPKATSIHIEAHWLVAEPQSQPQRYYFEEERYTHQHEAILLAFAWGKPRIEKHKERYYLWVEKT